MIRDELRPAADAMVKAAKKGAMRTSRAFILGAVTGGVVTWIWRRQLADVVRDRTRSLRRTEEALEKSKEQVNEVLRAGRQAIRP